MNSHQKGYDPKDKHDFEKFSNIEDLEERQKSYADFISSDINIEEAFDVYFVDEMYSCDFFYESLIERCKR